MKKKRPDHDERRRPLAEINLAQSEKARVRLGRSGCFATLLVTVAAVTALLTTFTELH